MPGFPASWASRVFQEVIFSWDCVHFPQVFISIGLRLLIIPAAHDWCFLYSYSSFFFIPYACKLCFLFESILWEVCHSISFLRERTLEFAGPSCWAFHLWLIILCFPIFIYFWGGGGERKGVFLSPRHTSSATLFFSLPIFPFQFWSFYSTEIGSCWLVFVTFLPLCPECWRSHTSMQSLAFLLGISTDIFPSNY